MQRVIDSPRTGEQIVIRRGGDETGGELLEFDLYLQPGGHVPARHLHPLQQERFTVLAGELRFRVGRRTVMARPGSALLVPRGTPHWFGNPGREVAHVRVEVRPALRMQELFESSAEWSHSPGAWWRRLLLLLDFQHEVGVPHVPARVISVLLQPLAWLRVCLAR
jgi:quercetin dioxygenase-like cupin family protein